MCISVWEYTNVHDHENMQISVILRRDFAIFIIKKNTQETSIFHYEYLLRFRETNLILAVKQELSL